MTDRDFQRQRVYDAENVLRRLYDTADQIGNPVITVGGITLTLPPEARFASIESVQVYLDRVLALPALAHYPRAAVPVTVRERRSDAKAHYELRGAVIAVPNTLGSWAMRETVVLHELAHHLAYGDQHREHFAATYLTLLGAVMGPEVELALRVIYGDHQVNCRVEEAAHVC